MTATCGLVRGWCPLADARPGSLSAAQWLRVYRLVWCGAQADLLQAVLAAMPTDARAAVAHYEAQTAAAASAQARAYINERGPGLPITSDDRADARRTKP